VLFTNKKSYTGFLLVPKLMTLNDLEPRIGHYFVISPKAVAFGAN